MYHLIPVAEFILLFLSLAPSFSNVALELLCSAKMYCQQTKRLPKILDVSIWREWLVFILVTELNGLVLPSLTWTKETATVFLLHLALTSENMEKNQKIFVFQQHLMKLICLGSPLFIPFIYNAQLWRHSSSMLNKLYFNVYWTVHHCNSWRMKDQLDVTCYFISLLMCSTCFGH